METIFTTKGHLPADQVELRDSVTETDDYRAVRTDKYLVATGEWVGNDVHVHMKRLPSIFGEQAVLG